MREFHGETKSPTHRTWSRIKNRCYNLNYEHYKDYGGRGITVCDRWKDSYIAFKQDMGEKPDRNSSIERIDVNSGYSKTNCKWASALEQGRNKRNNKLLKAYGCTLTLSVWCEALEIPRHRVSWRLRKGYSDHDSLFMVKRINQHL